ncbi:MAG: hypothetical protein K940chlam2_01350 [Chlamydiae bacterium]|nr:hypothetical protein [Chlamydiota bacterium]
MKKTESEPDFAASRVKKILDREKGSLSNEGIKEKDHTFSFQKRPGSLPGMALPTLPTSSRQLSAKRKGASQKETTMAAGALSQNQNYPLDLIEKLEALQSRAVKNLHVKEQIIAARRLKALGSEIQGWMFARFQWKARQMQEKEEEIPSHIPERQEERQFQITRIIPYLSDR